MRLGSTRGWLRRTSTAATMSRGRGPSASPPLSPCPRMSRAMTAIPFPQAVRQNSSCRLRLLPAPCPTTSPGSGALFLLSAPAGTNRVPARMKPDAGPLAPRVSSGRLRNRRPSTCTAVLWTVSGIVASLSVQVCEVREIPVSLLVVESVAYEKVVRNTEALIPHRDIHQTAVGPVQQRADLQRVGGPQLKVSENIMKG